MRLPLVVCCLLVSPLFAADDHRAFFAQHCIDCHGPDLAEHELRLDTLAAPDRSNAATWEAVVRVLDSGDMPPADAERPSQKDVQALLTWAGSRLALARTPAPGLRRMNRVEYEQTVQDLLGIDVPLAEYLPEDQAVQGFDNVAGGLGFSSVLLDRYLEAANVAFDATIRRIKPLPPQTRRAVLMERKDNIDSVKKNKGGVIESHGAFVDFTAGWPPARVDEAHPIEDGVYRCRVAVWPHDPGPARTLAVEVFTGPLFGEGKRVQQGVYDVTGTPDEPRIIEFTARMNEGDTLHVLPRVFPEHVTWRDKHEQRPGVAILWAETHGPLDQAFPSEATRRLFGDLESITMEAGWPVWMRHRKGVKRHHVASSDPRADVTRIVHSFAPRAFRRPVSDELVQPFVDLALARLDDGASFEDAVRTGVVAVLCSPHFLLLNQQPPRADGTVDDFTLASRLSYFLWSSLPDAALLAAAERGELRTPDGRRRQVERMLDDPKRARFVEHFTGQWLDLRDLEFTTPDAKLYPEYDDLLLRAMLAETRGFFRHLLDQNLPVANVIDSDFAVLNQRLATHYGIAGVRGHEEFRVVSLPEENVRGGVLTHASVLKVTANGTSTSPVLRGVWVIDNLLGQPSPPPPPGVPAVEPDIRGATTIREQLKLHSEHASCARCHRRIDPPGFALEEFDVIGGTRTYYRSLGEGERVGRLNYRVGPDVELGGVSASGAPFADFRAFRSALMSEPEPVVRAVATKLLIYGSGRPITAADRPAVDAIVDSTRDSEHGLRSLIHAVTNSEPFLRP